MTDDLLEARAPTRGGNLWGIAAVAAITVLAVLVGNWWVGSDSEEKAALAAASQVDVSGAAQPPAIGDEAPGFEGADLDGAAMSMEQLRGKPVWVLFMASWCAQCRVEAPDVQQAHVDRDDVEVVAVYLSESQRVAGDYAQRMGLTFTQVPDPAAQISAAYGVRAIPAHYFVDADGIVHDVAFGALSEARINELLDGLVAADGR